MTFFSYCSNFKLHSGYVTNNKCRKMQYGNYDIAIKLQYGVDLVGFPGEMRNPSKIGNVADLQVIRDKLKSGACKWVKMSREDKAAWAEKMQGKGGRQRAVRSDLGTKRPRKRTLMESSIGNRVDGQDTDSGSDDNDSGDGERAETSKRGQKRSGISLRAREKRRRVEKALPPAFKSAEFVLSDDEDSD